MFPERREWARRSCSTSHAPKKDVGYMSLTKLEAVGEVKVFWSPLRPQRFDHRQQYSHSNHPQVMFICAVTRGDP